MSGKGNSSSSSGNNNSGQSGNSSSGASEPQVVSGWQYHMYSQGSGGDRYAYIGKDESGEPEFIDYGPKGGRR
ncbi:hypothetical protein CTEN210_00419 [Chaetoceros tenuissimus]|uniref:Uncharacterized protein n=1 Tax=Chaetoceros tenuissimus TaxID=426638 RepID=A0AAD3CF45_9STRA|nr:hypothetical protein CTEN210_00419 [Chaetoceros tenuissimus]